MFRAAPTNPVNDPATNALPAPSGVVTSLATGTGVGQLLNASRGMLDYGMIWATACISVIVAVLAYHAVSLVERLFIKT